MVQEIQVDIYLSWTWVTVSHVTCQLPGSLCTLSWELEEATAPRSGL